MQNIMNRGKRGQSAVEFLLTYGWAILGALIAIGALSYFGIFNTQRYVQDTCYFGDQLVCEDFIAYQNGTVAVKLRNNFGVDIDINSSAVKSAYGITTDASYSDQTAIPSGSVFEIVQDVTSGSLPTSSKFKFKMTVTFKQTGSPNLHNQTGDVSVSVRKQ